MKTTITPLGDRILVDPEIKKTASTSGIIIPDSVHKDKPKQGKVLAIGTLEDVTDIHVGDNVLFSDYGYDEIQQDDHDYYIIQSKNILAKI